MLKDSLGNNCSISDDGLWNFVENLRPISQKKSLKILVMSFTSETDLLFISKYVGIADVDFVGKTLPHVFWFVWKFYLAWRDGCLSYYAPFENFSHVRTRNRVSVKWMTLKMVEVLCCANTRRDMKYGF